MLKSKMFRSQNVCLALNKTHIAKQNLPSPQDYTIQISFLTPSNLTELSACGCKGKCSKKYVPVLQEGICFQCANVKTV